MAEKGLTGKEAEARLGAAGVVVNKNAIPFDPRPPAVTSGIRLGTPLVSTLGMDTSEMKEIGSIFGTILSAPEGDDAAVRESRERVRDLCARFPAFPEPA